MRLARLLGLAALVAAIATGQSLADDSTPAPTTTTTTVAQPVVPAPKSNASRKASQPAQPDMPISVTRTSTISQHPRAMEPRRAAQKSLGPIPSVRVISLAMPKKRKI